ncbi:MAG TPA: hypothetical protein VMU59_00525 [Caulobacteraceae bacterium]|nr:hypothetical protein [Caulobacteraceae bacterium]
MATIRIEREDRAALNQLWREWRAGRPAEGRGRSVVWLYPPMSGPDGRGWLTYRDVPDAFLSFARQVRRQWPLS